MALRPADQSSYQNQSQAALHLPTVVVHLVPRTWDDWRPTHASHLDGISQRRCLFRNRRWTFTRWISFFLSTSIDILKSTTGWLFDWLSFQAIPYWFTLSLTLVYLPSKFISLVTMSCGMKSKTIGSIKAPDTRPYPSPWKKYRVWLPFISLISFWERYVHRKFFFADSCFPERWSHCFKEGKSSTSFYCDVEGSLHTHRYIRPTGMF